jgi:hypothetical protein
MPVPVAAPGGSNGLAVAALVMGILTYFCLGPLGAILAIVLGFLGLKRAKEINVGRGMSIAGIVLGGVGLVGMAIAVVILIIAGGSATTHLNNIGGVADASTYQLTQGSCNVDSFGSATFEGTIKNTTSSSKNFSVKAEFRNKSNGAVIDTSTDLVSSISAGDTAQWSITSSSTDSGTQLGCKVLEVDNFLN